MGSEGTDNYFQELICRTQMSGKELESEEVAFMEGKREGKASAACEEEGPLGKTRGNNNKFYLQTITTKKQSEHKDHQPHF